MSAPGMDHDKDREATPDREAAARMLHDADSVSISVTDGLDLDAEAMLQRWAPAVLFVYLATFLLLATYRGDPSDGSWPVTGFMYANILLIPLLTQLTLVQGVRNRLTIASARTLQGRSLLLVLTGILVFLTVPVASFLGVEFPWWVCVVVGAVAAVPSVKSAVYAGQRSRGRQAKRKVLASSPPDRRARAMTLGLGIYFGVAGASTVQPWFPLAAVVLTMGLVLVLLFANASWGLASVGSQWQQQHWVGFGCSFTMLFALTLLVVRASWADPLIGLIGGLVVAAPLVIAALIPGRRA